MTRCPETFGPCGHLVAKWHQQTFEFQKFQNLSSTGVSVMAKLPPGTYGTSDTPRPGAYGIIPVGRSAEPLDGCSCNLASICICCSRILFLLWSTLVRWPVSSGRVRTEFRRDTEIRPNTVRLRDGRFGRSPSRKRGYSIGGRCVFSVKERIYGPCVTELFVLSNFVSWLRRT